MREARRRGRAKNESTIAGWAGRRCIHYVISPLSIRPVPAVVVFVSAPPSASQETPSAAHARWFSEEVHAHESQLKAYLRSSFPAVRDVEDVVQESYLRTWNAKMARPILSAKAFLFQVARHLAIDAVRESKAAPIDRLRDLSTVTVIEDGPNAAEALSYQEKVSLVAAALAGLPARCREIFILRKFKQVPQRVIAAELRISERTVESQVTRGMKLMAVYLRKHGVDGFSTGEK